MDKKEMLQKLEQKMLDDKSLPLKTNLVFGEGNVNTPILFIGEAPGATEDQLKRPFVGRGGQLLNNLIFSSGWKRESFYITNIVKRRPPDNRDPFPEEIEAYKPYLAKQIEIINPIIIVTLGRFAMNYFMPLAKITRDQGKIFRAKDKLIVPMLHPAAALRSTDMKKQLEKSFKRLPKILEKAKELLMSDKDTEKNSKKKIKTEN